MKLIGINGLRGSGKDTAFQLLAEEAEKKGQRAVRRAFADKLKLLAASALGFEGTLEESVALCDRLKQPDIFIEAYSNDRSHDLETVAALTGRAYLQHFGQKHREHVKDTFWIDVVLPNPWTGTLGTLEAEYKQRGIDTALAHKFDNADYAVVTDVRYPNEAQRVLDLGGEVIEIVRPGLEPDGHSSEVPLPRDLVSKIIDNDSSLEALREVIRVVLLD